MSPRQAELSRLAGVIRAAASVIVWRQLEADPGFNQSMRAAEAELEAGGGVLYRVVRGRLYRVHRLTP